MKIFKTLIFANVFSVSAVSVNSYAVNHREKRFISDALQVIGSGVVDLGVGLEQNWAQVIESSMQDVVNEVNCLCCINNALCNIVLTDFC